DHDTHSPRSRVLFGPGTRGGIGQGARPQGREPRGKTLRHRRDCSRRHAQDRPWPWAAASFLSVRERSMTTRRNFAMGAGLAAGALAAPGIARAQARKWRMVTSWPKRLPGPGMSAERIAERIRALSGRRLDIPAHAPGEHVAALPLR